MQELLSKDDRTVADQVLVIKSLIRRKEYSQIHHVELARLDRLLEGKEVTPSLEYFRSSVLKKTGFLIEAREAFVGMGDSVEPRLRVKILIKQAKIEVELMNHFAAKQILAQLKGLRDPNDESISLRYRIAKCLYYLRLAVIPKLSKNVEKLDKMVIP